MRLNSIKKEFLGESAVIISGLFFGLGALLVKFLSGTFDAYFISLVRFIVGIIFGALIIVAAKREFKIYDKKEVILRSVYGSAAMILYYLSIAMTSSGRATLFNTTYPVFVVIFGALFFKEKLKFAQMASTLLCIAGIIFVFYDGSSYNAWGDLLGLGSGICGGMAVHYAKRARVNNDSIIIYMSVCAVGLVPLLPFSGQAVKLTSYLAWVLVLAGIAMFLGQVLFTYALKYTTAARGSILSFAKIPITIILSYFAVGESILPRFIIGTILIIAGLVLSKEKTAQAS
jgi:drug/metabolite transporter (DMT)-like permease